MPRVRLLGSISLSSRIFGDVPPLSAHLLGGSDKNSAMARKKSRFSILSRSGARKSSRSSVRARTRSRRPSQLPNTEKAWVVTIVLAAFVFLGLLRADSTGYVAYQQAQTQQANLATFSQCLTRNGVVLYSGQDSASKAQEAMFGYGLSYLDRVDCSKLPGVCEDSQIRMTPTWDIYGRRYTGIIQLGSFADITGCKL